MSPPIVNGAVLRNLQADLTEWQHACEYWEDRAKKTEAALTAALSVQWIPLPPKDTWLRTRREGEDGENVCMLPSFNDDEWIERDGGRTTVTHHSFAAPTHWQQLPKETP